MGDFVTLTRFVPFNAVAPWENWSWPELWKIIIFLLQSSKYFCFRPLSGFEWLLSIISYISCKNVECILKRCFVRTSVIYMISSYFYDYSKFSLSYLYPLWTFTSIACIDCSVCLQFWMLWQLMYKQWTFGRIFDIIGRSITEYLS